MLRFFETKLSEMATRCHPKDNGGKYSMWIRVEFTQGEHSPPHAHLYRPDSKPTKKGLITKFLITQNPPGTKNDVKAVKGKPPVPPEYAEMIVDWAGEKTSEGVDNWTALRIDWSGLEKTFK